MHVSDDSTDDPAPGRTILSVDDDPDISALLRVLLESDGYRVLCAGSGAEALNLVASERPDLILLDVDMPEMNGFEVCARFQEMPALQYVPVIFATARREEQDKASAFAVGAAAYLSKPIDPDALMSEVRAQLETQDRWETLRRHEAAPDKARAPAPLRSGDPSELGTLGPDAFDRFQAQLAKRLKLSPGRVALVTATSGPELYTLPARIAVSAADLAREIAAFLRVPFLEQIDKKALKIGVLPTAYCKSHGVAVLTDPDQHQVFVLANPFDWELVENIRIVARGEPVRFCIAPPEVIAALAPQGVAQHGGAPALRLPGAPGARREAAAGPAEVVHGAVDENAGPIVQLVHRMIKAAYDAGASDIHVEPWEQQVVIRFRVDGVLRVWNRLMPASLIASVATRIKVMAELDIAERRLPQDGRIAFKDFSSAGPDLDLRVAVSPMQHGEKVVMRLLDKQRAVLPLDALGFSPRNLAVYREKIRTPHGLILHVGPTGSGKSMTLYAALNEIQTPEINVQTAEDPIEYTLAGINQLQVQPAMGLTFARGLRSYLRQDPDVILVGEIRDLETAEVAIEAGLTGHLVLSTLHTNDAASTVLRLVEMGIEPFLVGSTLLVVCAQRLVRRLCTECREAYEATVPEKELVGAPAVGRCTLFRPSGCPRCNGIGYKGRIGVHEVLVLTDAMRLAVSRRGATAEQLKRMAVETSGMTTLYWDAMEKVRQGLCSVEDVLSNVKPDEFDARPDWLLRSQGIEHRAA